MLCMIALVIRKTILVFAYIHNRKKEHTLRQIVSLDIRGTFQSYKRMKFTKDIILKVDAHNQNVKTMKQNLTKKKECIGKIYLKMLKNLVLLFSNK